MTAQLERQSREQNSPMPAWSMIKEQRGYYPTGANPSSGSEQTKVVVTTRAMGTPGVKCLLQELALLGEVAMKEISLAGITCDLETELHVDTNNVFEMSNILGKYLHTNTFNFQMSNTITNTF